MNNKASFLGLFIFMIFAFVIIMVAGIWIYIGSQTSTQLHDAFDEVDFGEYVNTSQVIDDTYGDFNTSIQSLKWVTVFVFVAMVLGIFIGSYLVRTKPVFFVPYIFLVIIAVVVSVPISNTYEDLLSDATLGASYSEFTMANFVMLNLPIWIVVIGFVGGIIMFSQMGRGQEFSYYT